MQRFCSPLLVPLLLAVLSACSLPPDRPVTRKALLDTRIYTTYTIAESPEQVLNALNAEGEVILEAKRRVGNREYPVHVKILATTEGLEVLDYDR